MTDESVFAEALAIPDPAARAAFLDLACFGNAELRRQVEALLAAHGASNPLDRPPADLARTGAYEPQADDPPPAAVGDRVGPYRLMEQIGEGGFGLVFVAEQQEPVRRKVALKVLKPGMDSRDVVARFEAERQALALMDHPNIARVFDAGTTPEGRPFFVMELVRGVPITDYCDAQKLPPRDRLALFAQVCRAVQHAHQKGVIHRDIKPSNVLVTSHDGVPVPKVIDFGVAKAVGQQLTEKTIYTRFAQMIGTPLYMSPEQAEMSGLDVDTRADVYALGVLLYELLTGTTPFGGERFRRAAFDEIRRIIREEEPPRPSARLTALGDTLTAVSAARGTDAGRLTGLVRGELDWITMKALEKDRNRRYESAAGLAKEVERYLAGEAVEACPPTLGYRLRKAYRRNRAAVLVGSTFAGLVAAAAVTAGVLAVRATDAERAAARERDAARDAERREGERADGERRAKLEAEVARDAARRPQYVAEVNLAREAWEGNRVEYARALLGNQPPDLRHFEWFYLSRLMHPRVTRWPFRGPVSSNQLSWNRDGTRIVTGFGEVRDFASGATLLSIPELVGRWQGEPRTFGEDVHQFTGDGRWLIVDDSPQGFRLSTDSGIALLEPRTGELKHHIPLPSSPRFESFTIDAAGTRVGIRAEAKFRVLDLPTGKPVLEVERDYHSVLSPDGKYVARVVTLKESGEERQQVQLWSVEPFERLVAFPVPPTFYQQSRLLRFSPDGKRLAYVADAAHVMARGGRMAGSRWQDEWVCVCDATTGEPGWWLGCEGSSVTAAAWAADGGRFATGSNDGTVRVWTLDPKVKTPQVLRGQSSSILALAFRPDGQCLASQDMRGVTFWEPGTEAAIRTVAHPTRTRVGVRGLADGGRFFAEAHESAPQKIEVIERATGRVVASVPHPTRRRPISEDEAGRVPIGRDLETVVISPHGTHLVTVDRTSRLRLFSLDGGQEAVELLPKAERGDPIVFDEWCRRRPQFSPCGRYLVAYDRPSPPDAAGPGKATHLTADVIVWNLATKQRIRTVPNQSVIIGVCRFTHDGRLWVGSTNGEKPLTSALWSLTDPGRPPEPCVELPPGDVRAFHPETGLAVLSRVKRGPRSVVDVATGRERFAIPDGLTFAFSPDGRRLAAFASRDADSSSGIRVWDTATGREVLQSFPLDGPHGEGNGLDLTFGRDGRSVLLHSRDALYVWDGTEPTK